MIFVSFKLQRPSDNKANTWKILNTYINDSCQYYDESKQKSHLKVLKNTLVLSSIAFYENANENRLSCAGNLVASNDNPNFYFQSTFCSSLVQPLKFKLKLQRKRLFNSLQNFQFKMEIQQH